VKTANNDGSSIDGNTAILVLFPRMLPMSVVRVNLARFDVDDQVEMTFSNQLAGAWFFGCDFHSHNKQHFIVESRRRDKDGGDLLLINAVTDTSEGLF
jgi:hypothetical protein